MDDTEQDRTEQPTPFKLDRARRKGTVARGVDLGFLTGLSAFAGYAWILGPHFGGIIAQATHNALLGASTVPDSRHAVIAAASFLFKPILAPLALLGALIFAVVLLFEMLQTGVVFSSEPLKPDFTRLNPSRGLKRLFTVRMLIETLKNVLKLLAYVTVGYLAIRTVLDSSVASLVDGRSLAELMTRSAFRLLAAALAVGFLFTVLDQLIVRRDYLKRMRMSRREMRREMREREGEPLLKRKRKQMHAEFVKASQSLRNMRGADVLIANPLHIALALRYDRRTMAAPVIVSVGTNRFALRLKRLAFIYGVPVIEDKALARELLRRGALNRPIPDRCFRPVANIYNALRAKRAAGGSHG
ncbi:MAG: EscU/YscU/HrcU family type III secretion system export apparatus switch protein [Rhizomicrobium sp.]